VTEATALSPMMQQYMELKRQHQNHILFFRLGDFYEMFFEDAKLASRELELTLTGRDCGLPERAPMCGVPHHSCEGYIARLIKKGYKVAICEQVEDPREAKGIVRREVIRVVTPGTLIEDGMLDEGVHNFIASIYLENGLYGLAAADISTGEVHLTELAEGDDSALKNELARFSPSEILFNTAFLSKGEVAAFIKDRLRCCADLLEDERFGPKLASDLVVGQFQKDVRELGLADKPAALSALGGLIGYLKDTQKTGLDRLVSVDLYADSRFMRLDLTARRNLELTETMRSGEKRGSLLWAIDRTRTAMGKRLMRMYVEQPLVHAPLIEKRLNAVEELYEDGVARGELIACLTGIYDIERLITRIVYGSATPRELKSFEQAAGRLPALKRLVSGVKSQLLREIYEQLDPLEDLSDLIGRAVSDNPPVALKDGGVIRAGYSEELDRLRGLLANSKDYLAALESREREETGIRTLKVGYNKVFGYYLEVSKSYMNEVPDRFIRKQTLAGGERYITQELKELEQQIMGASESSLVIEARLFDEIRGEIARNVERIQTTASAVARLDVFAALAELAVQNNYCRPDILPKPGELTIRDGRHPVAELLLGDAPFVPNDTELDAGERRIAIITGPNMAGKSTYIRQTALIALLAQIGSFVPARSARIGVVDGIFTRVGASDDIAGGQSTFMVEMSELAQILKGATKDSLLILDEVGRGTSTFDGMSIARAVIEYIADPKKLGAKTMFATHYHELTELEGALPCVKNYNTAVKKRGDEITFLRKIVPGGIDDSYGIEVSKLAGIPDWIIRRAHEILAQLEAAQPVTQRRSAVRAAVPAQPGQLSLGAAPSAAEQALRRLNPDTFTPIEALNKLYELKKLTDG
jgi:DNA mismatch repair protein MutS